MKNTLRDKYDKKYLISHCQNADLKKKKAEPSQHIHSLSVTALRGSSRAREVSKSTEMLRASITVILAF